MTSFFPFSLFKSLVLLSHGTVSVHSPTGSGVHRRGMNHCALPASLLFSKNAITIASFLPPPAKQRTSVCMHTQQLHAGTLQRENYFTSNESVTQVYAVGVLENVIYVI